MIRKALLAAAAVSATCLAGVAQAQSAGTFVGTSSDGGTISMVIAGTSPNFTITLMNVNFLAACTHPARTASEGWGFSLNTPVVAAGTDFHSGNDYYDITGVAKFPNSHTIKGTITSVTAVFVPGATPPDAAQFCKSPRQAFMLTKEAPGAKIAPVTPGTAVALPKPNIQ